MAEHIKKFMTEEEVTNKIKELGLLISKDYEGKEVHIVCVLKGASFFACELAKLVQDDDCTIISGTSCYGGIFSSPPTTIDTVLLYCHATLVKDGLLTVKRLTACTPS